MSRALSVLLALVIASTSGARAGDDPPDAGADAAEVARLTARMNTLAQKNAWSGVERTYDDLVQAGAHVDRPTLLLAAEAARHRGDVLSRMARLVEARYRQDDPKVAGAIDDLSSTFGRVQLSGPGALEAGQTPFRPDAQQAVVFAQQELAREQRFDGYLPGGSYTFAGKAFQVTPGEPTVVVSTLPKEQGLADLSLDGVSIPRRATVGGRRLKLNGVGARAKLGVTIYVGALYVQEPSIQPEPLIRQDLPKRLTMDFVFRKTPRDAMTGAFQEGFAKVVDPGELAGPIRTFVQALDRDMVRGDRVIMDYVPDVGTLVSFNGREVARIEGRPFMWALFELFLGDDPPTKKLRAGMLGTGKQSTGR